jgi:hypothetical protein
VSGERILAWHFLPEDGRMTHRRGRPLIVAGAVHSVRGELKLCAPWPFTAADALSTR